MMKWLIKYYAIVLFIALFGKGAMAQTQTNQYLDSLLRIANKSERDSSSVNALIDVQRYFFERGSFDSTLKYATISLPLARAVSSERVTTKVLYRLGMTHTNLQHYDSANHYLQEALASSLNIKDTTLEVSCYNAFAILYSYQSDYATSIDYLLKAITRIDQSNSTELKNILPQAYGTIAYNFLNERQYDKAIEYGKKGLLLKNYPSEARSRVMLNLTVYYAFLEKNNFEMGKNYLDTAVAINNTLNNAAVAAMVANNEGIYYQRVSDFKKAIMAYLKSYRINKDGDYRLLQSEAADNVANLYLKLKDYREAERYALEANEIGKELKLYQVAASTYNVLKSVAITKSDYKSALEYAEQSKLYADSALNQETQRITLSLESKYQNQKKEREIATLTVANTQKELEVVRRNRVLVVGGIAASAAMIILGLFYRQSRQKQLIAEKEKSFQDEKIKFLERQQQVVSLQSMINGQETERTRIAKDLHDGLGGLFSTVKMYFSTLQHDQPNLKENELFQKSYAIVDTASVEVRRIAHNMMPEVLMKLGLVNALKDLSDNISAGKLLNVSFEVHGMNKRLNATTEIMLFRIIQELLNNIIKHAHATTAIIQFIREDERLSVIVEDNGHGFNTTEADERKSAGIAIIQSRVSYLNGKMSIDSQKNVGTTIMMDFLINEGDS